jgi:hypothetical protein
MTPTDVFFSIIPPSNVDGPNEIQSSATGAAAGVALFTGLAAADRPVGKVCVCFEALTADAYVRFGPATSAGTTAANGAIVKAGEPGRVFVLDPDKHAYMDVFSAGGSIKWYVCSPPGQRNRQ